MKIKSFSQLSGEGCLVQIQLRAGVWTESWTLEALEEYLNKQCELARLEVDELAPMEGY